eukprot:1493069-Alexandrium_andersonii.AAC.1
MGQQKREAGQSMRWFAAWAALRHRLEEALVIIEESDRFPESVLDTFRGKYYIETCHACPTEL